MHFFIKKGLTLLSHGSIIILQGRNQATDNMERLAMTHTTIALTGKTGQKITVNFGFKESFMPFCEATWTAQDGGKMSINDKMHLTKNGDILASMTVTTPKNIQAKQQVEDKIINLSVITNYFAQAQKMADDARTEFNADPIQKIKNQIAIYKDKAESNRDNCDVYFSYLAKAEALQKHL